MASSHSSMAVGAPRTHPSANLCEERTQRNILDTPLQELETMFMARLGVLSMGTTKGEGSSNLGAD